MSNTTMYKTEKDLRKEELDALFSRMGRSKKTLATVVAIREWFGDNSTNITYNTARTLWRRKFGRTSEHIVVSETGGTTAPEMPVATPMETVVPPAPVPTYADLSQRPPFVFDEGPARRTKDHGA